MSAFEVLYSMIIACAILSFLAAKALQRAAMPDETSQGISQSSTGRAEHGFLRFRSTSALAFGHVLVRFHCLPRVPAVA
jgi:hypothetical protein